MIPTSFFLSTHTIYHRRDTHYKPSLLQSVGSSSSTGTCHPSDLPRGPRHLLQDDTSHIYVRTVTAIFTYFTPLHFPSRAPRLSLPFRFDTAGLELANTVHTSVPCIATSTTSSVNIRDFRRDLRACFCFSICFLPLASATTSDNIQYPESRTRLQASAYPYSVIQRRQERTSYPVTRPKYPSNRQARTGAISPSSFLRSQESQTNKWPSFHCATSPTLAWLPALTLDNTRDIQRVDPPNPPPSSKPFKV